MAKKERKVFWPSLVVALTLLSALAFVAGRSRSAAVSHGAMPGAPSARSAAIETSYPAFTLISSRTVAHSNDQTRRLSLVQRSQRSDGVYMLVQTFYAADGATVRVQTYFGFIGLGVFRLDEAGRRLVFTGPQIEESIADIEQFLRANPGFAGEESVAGIRTIVWRQPGEDGPEDFFAEYRAPSLGGLVIKTVKVSGREREVFEPTAIQMGEPPANLFSELFSFASDYTFYERRVQEAEKHNEPDATFMRQLLERMRRARP
jgi:hypothetical protein